jgi:hypothetical protein
MGASVAAMARLSLLVQGGGPVTVTETSSLAPERERLEP